MIEIFINNNKYFFEKNITVFQACEQAKIIVPRFCYHEKLSVAGNCRMCLVEIEKSPKPVASCAMPIAHGMVIFTETPLVKKAREAVLEFLLINHPLDCPICDQAGECDLQDITQNFGSDRSRFFEFKHGVEDKECGPIIKTIMTRCIHCTRCVRFLTEIAGVETFGALGRGEIMEIGTFLKKYLKTEFSGNLADICPVGALTSKPYAFLARNWELKKIETIDCLDGSGNNIVIHTRNNTNLKSSTTLINDQILRILPKSNNEINENWISDKTRYSFDGLFFNRNFVIRSNSINLKHSSSFWTPALIENFFKMFQITNQKFSIIGNLGNLSSVEDCYFFLQFLKNSGNNSLLLNNELYFFNIDLPLFYHFNLSFNKLENSDLILLIGTNPRLENAMLNLKIRKHFFNKEILIGFVGTISNFIYPILHIGTTTKNLLQLVEGRHFFCKNLKFAKFPLIIVGSDLGYRCDYKNILNLIIFLGKKTTLNLKSWLGLNFLQQNLTQINACELGFALNSTNFLYNLHLNKNFLIKTKNFKFILNNNEKFFNFLTNTVFCSLNTHNQPWNSEKIFNFPIKTLYEKTGIIINAEGRVQQFSKTVTPSLNHKNSSELFQLLIKLQKNPQKTYKSLYYEAPFLKILNKNLIRNSFFINIFHFTERFIKIYYSTIHFSIKNFYMTDNISKNSKIMAECSLFLQNKKNFL